MRILSVGHEQKEVVKNWQVRVLCQFKLCTMAKKKKQGCDHLSGMFDSTAKTPCLTQPALQFSGEKIKLLTKKNSEQMLNQQKSVVAHCKSLVACETPGQSTREGYTKKMSPKCEDCNSAGGGGETVQVEVDHELVQQTGTQTTAGERKRMRGRERDGERDSNKKRRGRQRARAHSANTWIDVT